MRTSLGSAVLYVDGKVGGGATAASRPPHDCVYYFLFDWSGYTGNHTEQVKGTTANGVVVSSTLVTVKRCQPATARRYHALSEGARSLRARSASLTVGIIDPSQDEDFTACSSSSRAAGLLPHVHAAALCDIS